MTQIESKIEANKPAVKKKNALTVSFGKVSVLDIVLSIRHLSIMLKSSLAIQDALKVISQQSTSPKLKETYAKILVDVESGMSLSESMKKYKNIFSNIIVSIISAGEQGGTLEKNLFYLADYLKKDYELKKKVKGAMFYPLVVFFLTVGESLGVVFFIFPKLKALFTSFKNIPASTLLILNFSEFLQKYNLELGLGLLVFIFVFLSFLKTKPGKYAKDVFALHFPIIQTLNRHSILANFSRTLGILLDSGIPISKALSISADTVGNQIYSKKLLKIQEDVKSGKNLEEALNKFSKDFPPTFIKLIGVGEQTGSLQDNLLYLHEFYAEDVLDMSNNLATLIEPILLVFVGIMIGLLAISIIGPIYQLTSSINS